MLKSFCGWCVERKLMTTNPLASRRFARPKRKKKDALTLAQVNAVLAKATPLRRPTFAVLAFTGMRVGEVRDLRVVDVDLKNHWIRVRSREGFETKTGEERKLPIHPRLRTILADHKVRDSGWYFTALPSRRYPNGDHHINARQINEDLRQVLRKLGIADGRKNGGFTVHSFRHFFKTHCITNGIPKPVVDEWQGHSSGSNPSDHYFHLSDE